MFNHYTRMLDRIPRWSIFPTLRQQYVASHSFHVSLYVAEMIEEFRPWWAAEDKYETLRAALIHDVAEARMSDIPGPVKRQIRDNAKYHQLEHDIVHSLGYGKWWTSEEAEAMIKVADLLDEVFYIEIEMAMGNSIAHNLRERVYERLTKAIEKWDFTLSDRILSEVTKQITAMLRFETIENNEDLMPPAAPAPDAHNSDISF